MAIAGPPRLPPPQAAESPLLKNGHPAHVFTDDDRGKAAAVTNEVRREKRALFEQPRLNQDLEQMFARDAARRQRKAAKQRRRREEEKALVSIECPLSYEPVCRVDAPAPTAPVAPRRVLPANEQQALDMGLTGPVDIGRRRPFDPSATRGTRGFRITGPQSSPSCRAGSGIRGNDRATARVHYRPGRPS
jgi:hypothetical protein